MSEFVTKVKHNPRPDISFVILAGGESKKMKEFANRSLLKVNKKTIIRHQIDEIRRIYPQCQIVLVLGHEAELVYQEVAAYDVCCVFTNQEHHTYQAALYGIRAATNPNIFLLHNDILLNEEVLTFNLAYPTIVISEEKKDCVGIIHQNNIVTNITYGVKNAWQKIIYLTGNSIKYLRQQPIKKENWNRFDWELYNYLLELDNFHYHIGKVKEINTGRDLCVANTNKSAKS